MKRAMTILLAACLMLGTLAGCGTESTPATTAPAAPVIEAVPT